MYDFETKKVINSILYCPQYCPAELAAKYQILNHTPLSRALSGGVIVILYGDPIPNTLCA